MILLAAFAGIALLLSLIGIDGVMGNVAAHQTNEIGARKALRAQRSDILAMILRDGARLGLTGLGLGVAIALAASRLLQAVLFGVTPTDAATCLAVVTLMLAVCLVACYLPARRRGASRSAHGDSGGVEGQPPLASGDNRTCNVFVVPWWSCSWRAATGLRLPCRSRNQTSSSSPSIRCGPIASDEG